MDLVVSFIALVVLSPLMLVIAAAIAQNSGFPIFFRQLRIGRDGKKFWLFKFRTMTTLSDAEKGFFDFNGTRRVTSLGRFFRKTKLDELPQLWNVLKGEMSLVGPRPEVKEWVEVYPERWRRVHAVRPGITDPASILFRNEEELLASSDDPEKMYREEILPKKLDCYEKYISNRTIWGDIAIIFRTFRVLM